MKCFGNICRAIPATVVSLLLLSSPALAQVDTGTVQGTVRDASNAVVPGATVTLINVDMGVSFQTVTNDVGLYQFPSVRIGNYTVVAEASGFAPVTREGVMVSIQQRYVVDFALKPSNLAETVNVTGDAVPLQTQEASLGGVVRSRAINDLPLNGRNYTFLAQLNAGVVQAQQDTRGMAAMAASRQTVRTASPTTICSTASTTTPTSSTSSTARATSTVRQSTRSKSSRCRPARTAPSSAAPAARCSTRA